MAADDAVDAVGNDSVDVDADALVSVSADRWSLSHTWAIGSPRNNDAISSRNL